MLPKNESDIEKLAERYFVDELGLKPEEVPEQGYSPEAQKRLLWSFARENGFDVVEEFEDTETAKEAGRASFNAMLAYIRKGDVKHILVEKTDRLHRNFSDYVKVEEITKERDITVHFVKEGVSIGKDAPSSQKFMYGVRTLMAKNFIDNLSEEVVKGMNEKATLGEYPSKAPLGYKNTQDPLTKKQTIIVDEKNAMLVRAMYREYATGGHSLKSLIVKVKEMGLASFLPAGRTLTPTSTMRMLQNNFYIGYFCWKKKNYKGVHEPIVDADIWQKVQDVMAGKSHTSPKTYNITPFMFKGLLTCGECERCITAEKKKGRYVYYRCTKYGRICSQKAIKEETLATDIKQQLKSLQLSENGNNYLVAALKQSLGEKREWHDQAYEGMLAEKMKIRNRLDRMYEDRLDGKIAEEQYDRRFNEYTERMNELEKSISKHDRADVNYYDFGLRILELAKNAEKLFEIAKPEEKQELLRYVLSNSTLKDGKANFSLKQPFSSIAKRSLLGERFTWGAL